ncbi:MAG: glycosyltransferase [Tepidisphaeraceae bacterium]
MENSKHRFHVLALPHTRTSREFCACAYTQKVLNFCRMMRSLGHKVFHYGAEGSQVDCTGHVQIISAAEQAVFFGGVDWHKRTFPIQWEADLPYWKLTNERAAEEINRRKRRGDFVCLVGGACQKPIHDLVGEEKTITVEPFVGYYGIFARHVVFESYTHQAAVYAMTSKDPDGRLYDAVIPNSYDPADFPLGAHDGGYLLYLGRLARRKGLQIVLDVQRVTNLPLLLAGQGVAQQEAHQIVTEEGMTIPLSDKIQYVGYADIAQRAKLMGGARAVLMPTLYMEPFGGVGVEAQLCGTPVITTDHAAFSETVRHGISGYRCHTLEQFTWAVHHVGLLVPPAQIRERAIDNYSIHHVRWMYQEYFNMLAGLWDIGWPAPNPARVDLNWLMKR